MKYVRYQTHDGAFDIPWPIDRMMENKDQRIASLEADLAQARDLFTCLYDAIDPEGIYAEEMSVVRAYLDKGRRKQHE